MRKIYNVSLYDEEVSGVAKKEVGDIKMQDYDRLLEQFKKNDSMEKIKKECSEGLFLQEFSTRRGNIIKWLPIQQGDSILEIGSECGAISQKLLDMQCRLTCIDDSIIKSELNAYRNKEKEFSIYIDGTLNVNRVPEQERFDYIFVWKTNKTSINEIKCELKRLQKKLSNEGKLIVTFENRYGLRRWAGFRQEYRNGMFEEKREGYLSLDEIKKIEEDFASSKVFYPYPDSKQMITLYSDEFLPQTGELTKNAVPFWEGRVSFFDEVKAFDELISKGDFRRYANSYLLCIGG